MSRSPHAVAETLARAAELGLGDSYSTEAAEAVRDADLVIVSVPVGAVGRGGRADRAGT